MKLKRIRFTKKTFVILGVVVLAVACGVYFYSMRAKAENIHTNVSVTNLKKTDLQDTTSVSGIVHSDDSYNVYTTLTMPVKSISADVGDAVKKGDVLALLDTADLEKDIEQQQYVVEDTRKSAALALEKAKADYDNARYLSGSGLNSDVVTAQAAVKTAQDTYNYNQLLYDNGQLSKSKLDQSQRDLEQASKTLKAAKNQVEQNLKTMKNAYDGAVAKAADKSADAALAKLKKNLTDATITAPADGVVTAKNVSVGAVPTGVMFVVENTAKLIVDAQIKEIDAAVVKPGNPVTIRTDATGDKKIKGIVKSIEPAAGTDAAGTVAGAAGALTTATGTGSITYSSKISINESNPSLRIGMKARMDIVLKEKKGVFVVPYDALVEQNGGKSILAAEKTAAGYKGKKIPVKTGLETDVSVEISGAGLKEGLSVLNSPEGISDGDTVQLSGGSGK